MTRQGDPKSLRRKLVDASGVGLRVDVWLAKVCSDLSRSQVKKLIDSGSILIGGRPCAASQHLELDDEVFLPEVAPEQVALVATPMEMDIIFEDDDLLVVNKGSGLSVHP